MTNNFNTQIMSADEKNFDEQINFLSEFSSYPSTRGNEQTAQIFGAENLKERGYETDTWTINVDDITHLPGGTQSIALFIADWCGLEEIQQ